MLLIASQFDGTSHDRLTSSVCQRPMAYAAWVTHHESARGGKSVSSDFASTCAQLLPVFGLAAIAELVVFSRVMRMWLTDHDGWRRPDYWFLLILPGLVVYVLWAWVIFRIADDELLCLDALRQAPVPPGSEGGVRGTIDAVITLLIVLPTIAVPLFWLLTVLRESAKARATKRGPAYLDDEVELCIAVEPDYRLIPGKVNVIRATRTGVAETFPLREPVKALSPHPGMRIKAIFFRLLRVVRGIHPWLRLRQALGYGPTEMN